MVKKLGLTGLMIFSLCSCSSIELIHEPIGCLGQPRISLGFTNSEYETVTLDVEQKLIIFVGKLRARINAQCELNKRHDINHGAE